MFKKILEFANIYQYFFPPTGTLLRNLVLELGARVIYPEIVPYMKTWNLNWPVCIKRSEPQSLLVVMWPMTLPCSPWPNICLVTGFFFFLNILMHDGDGPLLYLHLITLFYHYHTTFMRGFLKCQLRIGKELRKNYLLHLKRLFK